jgi:carboxypeptidase Taq
MTPEAALEALLAHHRRIAALEDAAGILSWDQEVVMPPAGQAQRAESRGALAGVVHELRADPRIPDWIAAAEDAPDLSASARADLREAARAHARAVRVPGRLAEALAAETARTHPLWAAAREARDFRAFAPALDRILALKREEARALAGPGEDPYDALLDDFEPGLRAADLDPVFAELREGLAALLDRIRGSSLSPPALSGMFPEAAQMTLARELAAACGYDFDAGRIDQAVHPFSSGSGRDVRITTRVDLADPSDCAFSTLHEVGHALYEQGIAPELIGRPSGVFASMGVHESQSRLWENHVGRSLAFAPWLFGRMEIVFGGIGLHDPEALFAAVNRVEEGFIRTAADEAQYDLHILMRFDLERALLSGDLPAADLEGAWADRFESDFGRRPPDAAAGCLQDVHWALGLFGYFPTYTLGNLNAAALARAMHREMHDFEGDLATGRLAPVREWLRERVHRHGRVTPAPELMTAAAGAPVDAKPMLAHLEAKFAAIYDL